MTGTLSDNEVFLNIAMKALLPRQTARWEAG